MRESNKQPNGKCVKVNCFQEDVNLQSWVLSNSWSEDEYLREEMNSPKSWVEGACG